MKFSVDTAATSIEITFESLDALRCHVAMLLGQPVVTTERVAPSDEARPDGKSRRRRAPLSVRKIIVAMRDGDAQVGTPSEEIASALGYRTANALGPGTKTLNSELKGTGFTLDDIRTIRHTAKQAYWCKGPRFDEAGSRFFPSGVPSATTGDGRTAGNTIGQSDAGRSNGVADTTFETLPRALETTPTGKENVTP